MNGFNKFDDMPFLEVIRSYCNEHGELVTFKKGECFAEAAHKLTRCGIVKRGLFGHVVYMDDGTERITGFNFEESFVGNFLSIMSDNMLSVNIVALSDAEVQVCKASDIANLINGDIKNRLNMSEELFDELYDRYLSIYKMSPKDRYLQLMGRCPDLLQYITIKQLASFLQITPTHLSRIRNRSNHKQSLTLNMPTPFRLSTYVESFFVLSPLLCTLISCKCFDNQLSQFYNNND